MNLVSSVKFTNHNLRSGPRNSGLIRIIVGACCSLLLAISGFADLRAQTGDPGSEIHGLSVLTVANHDAVALGPVLEYYADSTGVQSLQSIRTLPRTAWTRSTAERLSLGIGTDIIWLRTRLRRADAVGALRLFCEQRLEYLTLYLNSHAGESANNDFIELKGGISEPRNEHRLPYFDLPLKPGEEALVYIRVESKTSLRMPFYIGTMESFYERDRWLTLMNGIFFAFIGAALIFNFGSAWRMRSSLPLLYNVWLLLVAVFQFVIAGYFFHNVSSSLFLNDRLGLIISCANSLPFVVFFDRLLLLKIHAPWIRRFLYALLPFSLVLGVAAAVPAADRLLLNRLIHIILLGFLVGLMAAGFRAISLGFRPALYSTLGSGIFIASLSFYLLGGLGILPSTYFTDYGMLFGYLGEFTFFIFSISARASVLGTTSANTSESRAIAEYASGLRRSHTQSRTTLANVDLEDLDRALDHLMVQERAYCDEDLTLQKLAALLDVSAHQLSEFLNKKRHRRFNQFLNEYRIAEARQILGNEADRTILDVALAVGFNSRSSFNAEFKRAVGSTPSEYRVKYRA